MAHHKVSLLILAVLICLNFLANASVWAQQPNPGIEPPRGKEQTQEVVEPAPKDIKEAVGIYVFLGWIWLSIFVLIYILRQKIEEVDRIYRLKFFSSGKN